VNSHEFDRDLTAQEQRRPPARTETPQERLSSAIGNRAFSRFAAEPGGGILAGGVVHPDVQATIAQSRGQGGPLHAPLRDRLSESLGDELGDVRVHTDEAADELSRSVSARAFATGSDIFFAQGEYQPESTSGEHLIAHEAVHVVQQRGAATDGPLTVSDPGDALEREADELSTGLDR
jgi:hypothetical protein